MNDNIYYLSFINFFSISLYHAFAITWLLERIKKDYGWRNKIKFITPLVTLVGLIIIALLLGEFILKDGYYLNITTLIFGIGIVLWVYSKYLKGIWML